MALSNNVVGAINLVAVLLSIPTASLACCLVSSTAPSACFLVSSTAPWALSLASSTAPWALSLALSTASWASLASSTRSAFTIPMLATIFTATNIATSNHATFAFPIFLCLALISFRLALTLNVMILLVNSLCFLWGGPLVLYAPEGLVTWRSRGIVGLRKGYSSKITAPQLIEFKMSIRFQDESDPDYKMIFYFPKLLIFSLKCENMVHICFPHHPLLQELSVDYVNLRPNEIHNHNLINVFATFGAAKFVTLSDNTIRALSKVPDVMKGKQSSSCGIEELRIIFKSSGYDIFTKFSFRVAACVLTYLLSNSPSFKGITLVHDQSYKEVKRPYFPSSVRTSL
ncbi:uncharacterized protein G2W53_005067 [Senna tora]|uniref:Uncharacterized protein n=1 Tax=Senna tora TaxID=362788 RepID=A0A834XCU8_9FABA|nr:uncharacterized protein G2W53_005067 [Senna tora]